MNNKGFTLVELIATIALLAILSIISFVSINAITSDSKTKNCNSLLMSITSATKEYISDNRYNFNDNNQKTIKASALINNKYLSNNITDPFSNNEINPNLIVITVTLNSDYTTKDMTIKANGIPIDCNNKDTFKNILK